MPGPHKIVLDRPICSSYYSQGIALYGGLVPYNQP